MEVFWNLIFPFTLSNIYKDSNAFDNQENSEHGNFLIIFSFLNSKTKRRKFLRASLDVVGNKENNAKKRNMKIVFHHLKRWMVFFVKSWLYHLKVKEL